MTETEALEVKEVVMKDEESDETQVEASVGVSEVVALVDEAHSGEEVTKIPEDEPAAPEESMEVEETSEEAIEKPEEVQEVEETSLETSSSLADRPEEPRPTPSQIDEEQSEVISNAHTSTEQEEVAQSQSIPDDSNNKGSITNVDENENLNDDKNVETIPSNTETLGDNDTTQSTALTTDSNTHSVLTDVSDENQEPAQIHIPEDEDADAQMTSAPSMNDSFTDLQETLIAHQSSGSQVTNVLKSVVDTTIGQEAGAAVVTSIGCAGPRGVTSTGPLPNGSQGLPMLVKPPKTDDLLATAKEVLQLRDPEPSNVIIGELTPGHHLSRLEPLNIMLIYSRLYESRGR